MFMLETHLDIVEVDDARGRGADAALVLLLADNQSLCVAIHDEAGDAAVALI